MEKKTILIPDIHGNTFWKDALKYIKSDTPVIFLGDYTDPHRDDGISNDEALSNFKEILEITKGRKNVEMLIGNHDLVYMFPDQTLIRSRVDFKNFRTLQEIFQKNKERFKLATKRLDYIISHAGINKGWLDYFDISISELIDIPMSQINEKVIKSLEVLSYIRDEDWGMRFGSIVWADFEEFRDKSSVIEESQIVGHTKRANYIGAEKIRNVICIDCNQCFFIDEHRKIRYLETEEEI